VLDDNFRREWAVQVAQERAVEARARTRHYDHEDAAEVERRPLERSTWLGLQVRSLLALIAVAEEGSFIGAATRLGYSRSTISHQIAQLEAAVGISLLVRGSGYRSVTLTAAGRVVVTHGRAVLRVLENAESQVAELSRQAPKRGLVPGLRWDNGAPPPRPATG
jgi:molybdenum-dependent DNA-binding transcriptional regulator ModE